MLPDILEKTLLVSPRPQVIIVDSIQTIYLKGVTRSAGNIVQKRVQQVVLQGVHRQVWENPWSEFSLDLHRMSSGASQTRVHAWLLNIHSIVFRGRELPEFGRLYTQ